MAVKFNKNFNINRVVKRLVYTILGLYVGGTIISTFGNVMNCTHSPFYTGLTLIGWTVSTVTSPLASGVCNETVSSTIQESTGTFHNVITSTTGSGVLAVVGIIGIAGVVMEFIKW